METTLSAEYSVLGCILLGDNEPEIFAAVDARDFLAEENRALYFEMQELWLRHKSVDIAAIPKSHLERAMRCAQFCPSVSSWRIYVETMRRDAAGYRVDDLSGRLVYDGLNLDEKYSVAEQILATRQGTEKVRRMGMAEARRAFFAEQVRQPDYVRTGIAKLDRTAHIERGDYVVIGARPSVGKTALALQFARKIAESGRKVIFYSYETTVEKLEGRTIAGHCEINMEKIKQHKGCGPGTEGIGHELDNLQLEFVESGGKGIEWLMGDILIECPDVVFIDYIGLIPSQGTSRFEKITENSLGIRGICQRTGVTVFALCQINREGKASPQMEDLKESGQIEQDADVILLLHNPMEISEREAVSEIQLIVAKNKEGRVGKLTLFMDGTIQRFYDTEARHEQ